MTFPEYLKARGVDEASLSPPERAFALKMFGAESTPEPEAAYPAKDCAGADLKVGDIVTVTYKVTNIVPVMDHETGLHKTDIADLSLSRQMADGSFRHSHGCPSHHVKKS